MADKGFHVEDLLVPTDVCVNILPLKGAQQLSGIEVLHAQHIFRVRIHIERAIARVKNFCMLKSYSAVLDWLDQSDLDSFLPFDQLSTSSFGHLIFC